MNDQRKNLEDFDSVGQVVFTTDAGGYTRVFVAYSVEQFFGGSESSDDPNSTAWNLGELRMDDDPDDIKHRMQPIREPVSGGYEWEYADMIDYLTSLDTFDDE